MYTVLFRSWGILPNEAGLQNPFALFELLDELERAEEPLSSDIETDEHLKMFYGQ